MPILFMFPFQDCDCGSMQQLWQIFHETIGGRSLMKYNKLVIQMCTYTCDKEMVTFQNIIEHSGEGIIRSPY